VRGVKKNQTTKQKPEKSVQHKTRDFYKRNGPWHKLFMGKEVLLSLSPKCNIKPLEKNATARRNIKANENPNKNL